jgi:hypothetical protein
MAARLLLVLVLAGAVAVMAALHRRRAARLHLPVTVPPLPGDVTDGADRTWVVFTTPYCATCGPVKERIGSVDPGARIVEVDVADRPDLARTYHVRSAPTVLLADHAGQVLIRLVGNIGRDALAASLV